MNWTRMLTLCLALALWAAPAAAADNGAPLDPNALDHQLQALKEDVLAANRDLLVLQEDLLFPASRQIAVYLSMDRGSLFKLDSVELRLNDQVVARHLYSARELDALSRGGSHQLWIGNIATGEYELLAFLTGIGPNGREYRRGATLTIAKTHEPKTIELKVSDRQRKLQPEFVIREWQ
jgi:hypothetical protein